MAISILADSATPHTKNTNELVNVLTYVKLLFLSAGDKFFNLLEIKLVLDVYCYFIISMYLMTRNWSHDVISGFLFQTTRWWFTFCRFHWSLHVATRSSTCNQLNKELSPLMQTRWAPPSVVISFQPLCETAHSLLSPIHTNPDSGTKLPCTYRQVGIIYGTASGSCADIAQAISKSVPNCAPPLNIEGTLKSTTLILELCACEAITLGQRRNCVKILCHRDQKLLFVLICSEFGELFPMICLSTIRCGWQARFGFW